MATSRPSLPNVDPLTFTTWSDAFAHPIPQVRTLESQLRKHILENQNKLRSLVGNSYRDLLGTAEKIIEMDENTEEVEGLMGEIARRCNSERIGRGWKVGRGYGDGDGREGRRKWWLVNVRVLGCVLDEVSGCIKRRRGVGRSEGIVAAKLLVLARLVLKSLGNEGADGEILDELRKRIVGLRKRLLRYIDAVVRKQGGEKDMLVDTLCAYALLTSSSPAEVLKYFLATRFEKIQAYEDAETAPTDEQVLELVDLYAATLADARAVFPKLFSESMVKLQKVPLFEDPQITGMGSLNLDVYGRWIDESIRTFTPWVRQEQLSMNDVSGAVISWATQAQGRIVAAVEACLEENGDMTAILAVRTGVLQRFLPLLEPSSKSWQESHLEAFHRLRKAFLQRLEQVATLTARVVEDQDLDASSSSNKGDQDMWSLVSERINVKAGGSQFRQMIVQRRHGRPNEHYTSLNEWVDKLDEVWEAITSMRTAKWDLDEIDVEITEGDPLSVVLSKKDSDYLQSTLRKSTTTALQNVYSKIEKSALNTTNPPDRLLRDIREVDARRQYLGDRVAKDKSFVPERLIPALHKRLAEMILKERKFEPHVFKTSLALWDGTPELPVQPSPRTYRMLIDLQKTMAKVGSDLWTRDAVAVFKSQLAVNLADQMKQKIELSDQAQNQHEEGEEGSTVAANAGKEHTTQRLFDALYLQRVVGGSGLEAVIKSLQKELELETALYDRLNKSAGEYWKRTYLLFGLLAT